MQKLCIVLLAASTLVLAGKLNPVTVLPEEIAIPYSEEVTRPATPPAPAEGDGFVVGVVDTVGGTTYDWCANGPIYRMLCNSPDYGIHVVWMYSASDQTTHPDRNMRYNFYDYSMGMWNWIDPDYMQSGVNVFTERCGYGNLDVNPVTDVATVPAHLHTPLATDVARDLAPGAGIFEYCPGSPALEGYLWPPLAVSQNQTIHLHMIDDASRNAIFYSRGVTWCDWSTPVGLAAPQPNPTFPNHNIAASKVSDKVCVTWEFSGGSPDPGFYRISTDGGTTWGNSTDLPWPAAHGGDTATSYHITSFFPYYDRQDKLHILAGVMPFVAGQGYIIPADIWHWSPDNTPNWARIHRGTCQAQNLQAAVGYNALYACRPSIGEDRYGGLYVAWEQFDSSNVEPGPPELLRADIFYARDNYDNGQTWTPGVKITDRSSVSHRFPSIIDRFNGDTLYIFYQIDQHAGFFVQGQGPCTNNAMVVHKVPVTTGIKEQKQVPLHLALKAEPNPFSNRTRLNYSLPSTGRVELEIYDPTGRSVASRNEFQAAGRYTVTWHAQDMSPGVYVVKLKAGNELVTRKLVMTAR